MRTCNCGETDSTKFRKRMASKDKLDYLCKICARKYDRIKYHNNRDKLIARAQKFRNEHPDKVKKSKDKYNKANRKILLQRTKQFKKDNPEKVKKTQHNCDNRDIIELKDRYIKQILRSTLKLSSSKISQDFIDLKRTQIQLKRAIQNEKSKN